MPSGQIKIHRLIMPINITCLLSNSKCALKTSSLSEDMLTVGVGVAEDTVREDEGTKCASGSVNVEEDIVHSIVGEWVYQKNTSGGLTSSAKAAQHSRILR